MQEPVGHSRPLNSSVNTPKRAALFAEASARTLRQNPLQNPSLLARINAFHEQHIYPNEASYHAELEELRRKGKPWQTLTLPESPKIKALGLKNN
jgi:hypothetical protein